MRFRFIRAIALILPLIIPFNGLHAAPLSQVGDSAAAQDKLSPALQAELRVAGSGPFDVIVRMETQAIEADPTLRRLDSESGTEAASDRLGTTIRSLQAEARQSQSRILTMLTSQRAAGKVDAIQPFWIFNGLAVSADADTILAMAALPEVASIVLDETLAAPTLSAAADEPVQWNVSMVKVPALWELGFRGQGMVAANLDTGVYLEHPDLVDRWRGGDNSWFDPYGQHLFPADAAGGSTGHGTSTMSIMVGGSTSGSSVGIAPEAQWIAAKIFDDRGQGRLSAIHAAYQWVLDPDGNPATDDAPDVVNSSWTFLSLGCNLEFELDLEALRAGGVLPVFAAGNLGGRANTSVSPANNPAAFAVGAVDRDLTLYAYSSQGPSSCLNAPSYPAVVAPGVDVIAADANGLHHLVSGTSLAAPHVSGLLLLLLQAFPGISAAQQAESLRIATSDLGGVGIDNIFGYGLVDVQSTYDWLTANPPTPESTPVPSTPTPVPSTPTPTEPGDGTGTPAPSLYFSIADRGPRTIGGVPGVNDEDVVVVRGGETRLYFDGSDVGLTQVDVDAFAIVDEATLLLSFDRSTVIDGLAVDDSDIVAFHATSLGDETAGFFSLYLSGLDEGLYTNGADVDAVDLLDDGRLLISLRGRTQLPGLAEAANGDDVLLFTPAALRKTSADAWTFALRGSELGLDGRREENLDGIVMVDPDMVQMSFVDSSVIPGLVVGGSDVLECALNGTGELQSCMRSTLFTPEMLQVGFLATNVDAIEISR